MVKDILLQSDISSLLIKEGNRKDIVIGVPHHAPFGVSRLPCKEHNYSDENAGLVGFHLANLLQCSFIIATNYFIDSNKAPSSDYFRKLESWKPEYLVEIHGHGGRSARYDIEISSGEARRNKYSKDLSDRLRSKFDESDLFKNYTISGDFKKIYFTAKYSKTINSRKWIPFHIELPKSIRKERSKYLNFCKMLAPSIIDLINDEKT